MVKQLNMHTLLTALNVGFVTLIASLLSTDSALAADCYAQSPYLKSQGDAYYDLDDTLALTNADQEKIAALLKDLTGMWHGELTGMNCKGPDSAPTESLKTAELTVKAEQQSDETLRLHAQKRFIKQRIRKLERLDLMPNTNLYAIEIKGNALVFSERYRRNINKTSRLTEVLYLIQTSSDGLAVHRSYYTNGVLTGAERWDLTR